MKVANPADSSAATGFVWLDTLWATVAQRAADRPEGSYTARLLDGGVDAVSRKVAEEDIEVVVAAKDHAVDPSVANATALTGELADLLYHSLVLMAERQISPSAVMNVLESRTSSVKSRVPDAGGQS